MRLSIKNLTKRYHTGESDLFVLNDVSFDFPSQGIVAIVGRSGVGKSTLLQLLGGLDAPTRGAVQFDGISLSELSRDKLSSFRGQNIGFVFQFHHLLPEFSAIENVSMPLIINGMADDEAEKEASIILVRVGMGDRIHHRPGALSGGEQQRVAIARAIVGKPRLVLLDEPTGNLDIETAKMVQSLLKELQQELGNLMIVVTHSLELAGELDLTVEMTPGGALIVKN